MRVSQSVQVPRHDAKIQARHLFLTVADHSKYGFSRHGVGSRVPAFIAAILTTLLKTSQQPKIGLARVHEIGAVHGIENDVRSSVFLPVFAKINER